MRKGKMWLGLLATGILLSSALISVTNVAMDNEMLINDVLGLSGTKIESSKRSDYADENGNLTDEGWKRMIKDSYDFCIQEEEEGAVLLKNENNALPLDTSAAKEKAISCFGWAFSHPVYGGTGSGDVDTATCVTPQIGLENAGFTVNPALASAYDTWSKDTANNYTNAVNTVGNNTTTALMSA